MTETNQQTTKAGAYRKIVLGLTPQQFDTLSFYAKKLGFKSARAYLVAQMTKAVIEASQNIPQNVPFSTSNQNRDDINV